MKLSTRVVAIGVLLLMMALIMPGTAASLKSITASLGGVFLVVGLGAVVAGRDRKNESN